MILCFRGHPQSIPGGASITTDRAVVDGALQNGERIADHRQKLLARQRVESLLRIVQVIHIDRLETEVSPAAGDLILEEAPGQTMSASDNVGRIHDSAREILFIEEATIVLLGCRRIFVERDVPGLRANYDLLAFDLSAIDALLN